MQIRSVFVKHRRDLVRIFSIYSAMDQSKLSSGVADTMGLVEATKFVRDCNLPDARLTEVTLRSLFSFAQRVRAGSLLVVCVCA